MNNVQLRVGDLLYAAFKRWKMILAIHLRIRAQRCLLSAGQLHQL